MKRKLKTCLCLFFVLSLTLTYTIPVKASKLNLSCKSAILIEQSTGTILYEKDAHKKLRPASITKIMTLLLIFEALDSGKINLSDTVTTSEHAASMGGSNVFLEANEQQTVETMIKCICISSANDAAVAMAEHLAGSEENFVSKMNKKAETLGMQDTNFVNACGLDADNHFSSAFDIALMSRELLEKHPNVLNYTKIWMDSFEHVTRRGTSVFQLSNTNKLLKQYPYTTGLKTGSTSLAKYSISASATKENLKLIAVVMAAPDFKERFANAKKLLDYGFANTYIKDATIPKLSSIKVIGGDKTSLPLTVSDKLQIVLKEKNEHSKITSKINLPKQMNAPIKKNAIVGTIDFFINKKKVGSLNVFAANQIQKLTYKLCLCQILQYLLPF